MEFSIKTINETNNLASSSQSGFKQGGSANINFYLLHLKFINRLTMVLNSHGYFS